MYTYQHEVCIFYAFSSMSHVICKLSCCCNHARIKLMHLAKMRNWVHLLSTSFKDGTIWMDHFSDGETDCVMKVAIRHIWNVAATEAYCAHKFHLSFYDVHTTFAHHRSHSPDNFPLIHILHKYHIRKIRFIAKPSFFILDVNWCV